MTLVLTDFLSTFTGIFLFFYLWYSTIFVILLPNSSIEIIIFANILAFLTIYSYTIALLTDAGSIQVSLVVNGRDFCKKCQTLKPARAHHCHNGCNKCSLKMDHHCPWLGRCVGHRNMGHFIRFVFYALISSIFGTIMLSIQFAKSINNSSFIFFSTSVILLFNLIIFSTLGILLFTLFLVTLRNILQGITSIERLIFKKKKIKTNPYDLGYMKNLSSVLGSRPWTWPLSTPFANWQLGPYADGYSFDSSISNFNSNNSSLQVSQTSLSSSDDDAELIMIPTNPSYRRKEILFSTNQGSSNTSNSKIL